MGEISETAQRAIIIALLCVTLVGVVLSAVIGFILRRIIFKKLSKIAEERRKQSGQPDEQKEDSNGSTIDGVNEVEDENAVEMQSVSSKSSSDDSQNTSQNTSQSTSQNSSQNSSQNTSSEAVSESNSSENNEKSVSSSGDDTQ